MNALFMVAASVGVSVSLIGCGGSSGCTFTKSIPAGPNLTGDATITIDGIDDDCCKKTKATPTSYINVADHMECSRTNGDTYTLDGADGWARTSLSQCMSYCDEDAVPPGASAQAEGQTCRFVVWVNNPDFPPGWCHLASSCDPDTRSASSTNIWQKPQAPDCAVGKTMTQIASFGGGSCSGSSCPVDGGDGVSGSFYGLSDDCCKFMTKPSGMPPAGCPPSKFCEKLSGTIKKPSMIVKTAWFKQIESLNSSQHHQHQSGDRGVLELSV